jgi:N-acetylglucosamine-6-sulfatase
MPRTWQRVVQQGVRFTRAYVTTAYCQQSRLGILTGSYFRDVTSLRPLTPPSFAERLHAAGYRTAMVGKFLNSWDGSPRSEYDFWVASAYNEIDYADPYLNVNGAWGTRPGYSTYVLRDYALQFLRHAPAGRPFLLYFAPVAVHGAGSPRTPKSPAVPAPEDQALYSGLPAYQAPSLDEADVSDKPAWLQALPRLTAQNFGQINYARTQRLRALMAVDRAVDALLTLLEQRGRLGNTFVLFMSDNGYFYGEHRLWIMVPHATSSGKNRVYEEAHAVPFAVRYPPLVSGPRADASQVANIDIAPTLYELAGLAAPAGVSGRSLVPLLRGSASGWRSDLLLESAPNASMHAYSAVRTPRYLYAETAGDAPELYDESADAAQLQSVALRPAYDSVVARLRTRLHGAW